MGSTAFVRVGALAEVPDGEIRPFDVPWGRVAVAHIENDLYALADECTNDGCALSEGGLDERRDTVIADCGCEFDLRTGEPLEAPGSDPVPVFAVHEVDGWLEVAARPGAEP